MTVKLFCSDRDMRKGQPAICSLSCPAILFAAAYVGNSA